MLQRKSVLLSALMTLLLAAVSPAARAQSVLTVSAAASLTDAFKQIGGRFEALRPGTTVRFNFAASGVLIQQILQGAPVDVFVSADQETMARGIEQRVLDPATRRTFASNTLVLVTPAQGGPAIRGLADLAAPAVRRIALGKLATVPVGRYAKAALDKSALFAAIESRVVYADSVRQVLDYVARGEVDAGFVYRTDAEIQKGQVTVVQVVEGHDPVLYPAAAVAGSRQPETARAFVEFLLAPEAQAILSRHGFGKP